MKPRLRLFICYWLPVILYCLLIFLQSSQPSPERLPQFPLADKLVHFLGYGILGLLFIRAFQTTRLRPAACIILSILAAILYGISDEIHQIYVPTRHSDPMDMIANTLGSIFGVLVGFSLMRKQH